ncbi:MAG: Smr/MutS family protein [Desulforegulaceae bacterium]|nr:Smr/MutS family protein [Desulforegulaceae bacterium]
MINLIKKIQSFFKKSKNFKGKKDLNDNKVNINFEPEFKEKEERVFPEKPDSSIDSESVDKEKIKIAPPLKKISRKKNKALQKKRAKEKIRQISMEDDLYELFTGKKNPGIKEYSPSETIRYSKPDKNCLKTSMLKPQEIVDLHGLSFLEADKRIENKIISAKYKGVGSVQFITGKGKHSKNMKPVLRDLAEKKAVEMKKNGEICSFAWEKKQKKKSGAITFYLV